MYSGELGWQRAAHRGTRAAGCTAFLMRGVALCLADDGHTRAFQRGEFALTPFTMAADAQNVTIVVAPVQGFYDGMLSQVRERWKAARLPALDQRDVSLSRTTMRCKCTLPRSAPPG